MKVVIIEDEKITAKDLSRTIMAIEPDAKIVAMLHSVEEAIAYFAKDNSADVIFSDIQLGDGLSFDIFKKLSLQIPIIFCTAFNSYLLDAFKVAGIDYVLKPFTKHAIENALHKFKNLEKNFSRNNEEYRNTLSLIETQIIPKRSSIIIRQRDKIIPLQSTSIALLYIENGCTFAYTFQHEKYMINDNLEELEQSFMPNFFRANRQYLINRTAIKDASQFFNRKMLVNLTIPFKEQILVGKLKTISFIEWLSKN